MIAPGLDRGAGARGKYGSAGTGFMLITPFSVTSSWTSARSGHGRADADETVAGGAADCAA